jgi:hypothetical protein
MVKIIRVSCQARASVIVLYSHKQAVYEHLLGSPSQSYFLLALRRDLYVHAPIIELMSSAVATAMLVAERRALLLSLYTHSIAGSIAPVCCCPLSPIVSGRRPSSCSICAPPCLTLNAVSWYLEMQMQQ